MTCSRVKLAGHEVVICHASKVDIRPCHVCGAIADRLCDWRVPGGTCDNACCELHAHRVGKNKDLCFVHMNAWRDHPANAQQELAL